MLRLNTRADAVARRAATVLEHLGGACPPVELERLCEKAGVALFVRPFDYVAGVLIRDAVFPVIVVNARERHTRQRFTIAHELGHYFLNHRGRTFAEPGSDGRQERDAELFAACLLMPEAWLRDQWAAYAGNAENRPRVLAEFFDVSLAALEIRVRELGLDRPRRR